MTRKGKLATFNIDHDIWERFKANCLEAGSNASAELVAFINRTLDGEETASKPTIAIDPSEIARAIEQHLDSNIDRYLERYRSQIAGEEKAIDTGDEPESELEHTIVTVETYAICQCRDGAIASFWTGGGWAKEFGAAKIYAKEGTAKTQVVRLQKNHPGTDIRYNSIERIRGMLDRLRVA